MFAPPRWHISVDVDVYLRSLRRGPCVLVAARPVGAQYLRTAGLASVVVPNRTLWLPSCIAGTVHSAFAQSSPLCWELVRGRAVFRPVASVSWDVIGAPDEFCLFGAVSQSSWQIFVVANLCPLKEICFPDRKFDNFVPSRAPRERRLPSQVCSRCFSAARAAKA